MTPSARRVVALACAGIAAVAVLDILSQTAVFIASSRSADDVATWSVALRTILGQVSPVTGVLALWAIARGVGDRSLRPPAASALVAAGVFGAALIGVVMGGLAGADTGGGVPLRITRQTVGSGAIGALGLALAGALLLRPGRRAESDLPA